MGREMQHRVAVDDVERRIGEVERLAVHHEELALQAALGEIRGGERDGSRGQVDAANDCAALREAREIVAQSAADIEQLLPAISREVYEHRQVMELFEAVGLSLREELRRADGMGRDFPVVYVPVPIGSHGVEGATAQGNRDRAL